MQYIISENIPPAKSRIKNSFEFHNKLTGMMIDKTKIMVSLDVTSLFINVALDVALDRLVRRWDPIKGATNIPKNEFINVVKFVLTSTYFTSNGIIYKQTFGTLMGSPFPLSFLTLSWRIWKREC